MLSRCCCCSFVLSISFISLFLHVLVAFFQLCVALLHSLCSTVAFFKHLCLCVNISFLFFFVLFLCFMSFVFSMHLKALLCAIELYLVVAAALFLCISICARKIVRIKTANDRNNSVRAGGRLSSKERWILSSVSSHNDFGASGHTHTHEQAHKYTYLCRILHSFFCRSFVVSYTLILRRCC